MLYKRFRAMNGDVEYWHRIYKCDDCLLEMDMCWPMTELKEQHFCGDCAFIRGLIEEKEFLRYYCGGIDWMKNSHAAVHEGKVYTWVGVTAPWEPTIKELRASPEYRSWRKAVFAKSKGKCAKCKTTESLQAHHKKSFSYFPELRYEVSNGQVLCKECHRKAHAKKPVVKRKKVVRRGKTKKRGA